MRRIVWADNSHLLFFLFVMHDAELITASERFAVLIILFGIKESKEKRGWMSTILKSRKCYSGSDKIRVFTMQELMQFKLFSRMFSGDFYFIITLVGSKRT